MDKDLEDKIKDRIAQAEKKGIYAKAYDIVVKQGEEAPDWYDVRSSSYTYKKNLFEITMKTNGNYDYILTIEFQGVLVFRYNKRYESVTGYIPGRWEESVEKLYQDTVKKEKEDEKLREQEAEKSEKQLMEKKERLEKELERITKRNWGFDISNSYKDAPKQKSLLNSWYEGIIRRICKKITNKK